ncbi:MAG: TonB-dependent receptor [Bryobacteraceae bacterium]
MTRHNVRILFILALALCLSNAIHAQGTGAIRGTVTLEASGAPLHHVTVTVVPLGLRAQTNHEGAFEFRKVPPGRYDVLAHMHALTDARRTVNLTEGGTAEVSFQLKLSPVRDQLTVTATGGREQTTLEAFQTVASLESFELTNRGTSTSLGDLLEFETGVAKRSFGPGTTRPVLRGFDGDRVLILQDGIRTGTLSSQSGDHGEPLDAATIERVEVVRGPATLLYGSNAIGGVVNTISGYDVTHQHPRDGLRGYITALGGTTNAQGGGAGGFDFGHGNWTLWGNGGGQRSGDYNTPLGHIDNSWTDLKHSSAGFGRFGEKFSFNLNYGVQDGRYGVPFAGEFHGHHDDHDDHDDDHDHDHHSIKAKAARIRNGGEHHHDDDDHHDDHDDVSIAFRRQQFRFNGAVKNLGSFLDQFHFALNYSDWNHRELEGEEIGTRFFNKQFVYRGTFQQRRVRALNGSFGLWGMHRDFKARGVEALAPPTTQDAFALFGFEEFNLERVRFQFGGRYEHNRYNAQGLQRRSFNGFSGSAGVILPVWEGGALATNFAHSFRAPALEELYNRGPHIGNLTYEIGNPNLRRERSNGLDVSLRQQNRRLRAEANFFYNSLNDFVYLAPTGDIEHGLVEARYMQADSRYMGAEGRLDVGLHNNLWLNLGFDSVRAELRANGTPLPRIPPVRGRVGFDARYRNLSLRPELIMANAQERIFLTETPTAGYVFANLRGSYTIPRQHFLHMFSVNVFNMGDALYRNHLSFIKDMAPEIGRGVRVSYTIRWF